MKWFVTEAQLAAMRATAAEAAWADYRHVLTSLTTQHDAEMQHLREDRAAELARVTDPSAAFVAHLKDEVAFWRMQYQHERQRSEVGLDVCRASHLQLGPISLPLRSDAPPRPHVPTEAEMELALMGSAEGV